MNTCKEIHHSLPQKVSVLYIIASILKYQAKYNYAFESLKLKIRTSVNINVQKYEASAKKLLIIIS
jgi:hypothetical protein